MDREKPKSPAPALTKSASLRTLPSTPPKAPSTRSNQSGAPDPAEPVRPPSFTELQKKLTGESGSSSPDFPSFSHDLGDSSGALHSNEALMRHRRPWAHDQAESSGNPRDAILKVLRSDSPSFSHVLGDPSGAWQEAAIMRGQPSSQEAFTPAEKLKPDPAALVVPSVTKIFEMLRSNSPSFSHALADPSTHFERPWARDQAELVVPPHDEILEVLRSDSPSFSHVLGNLSGARLDDNTIEGSPPASKEASTRAIVEPDPVRKEPDRGLREYLKLMGDISPSNFVKAMEGKDMTPTPRVAPSGATLTKLRDAPPGETPPNQPLSSAFRNAPREETAPLPRANIFRRIHNLPKLLRSGATRRSNGRMLGVVPNPDRTSGLVATSYRIFGLISATKVRTMHRSNFRERFSKMKPVTIPLPILKPTVTEDTPVPGSPEADKQQEQMRDEWKDIIKAQTAAGSPLEGPVIVPTKDLLKSSRTSGFREDNQDLMEAARAAELDPIQTRVNTLNELMIRQNKAVDALNQLEAWPTVPAPAGLARDENADAVTIVTNLGTEVDAQKQALATDLDTAASSLITGLKGFSGPVVRDHFGLERELTTLKDAALARAAAAPFASTLPLHEVETVMEALRSAVPQNDEGGMQRAANVLIELRKHDIASLLENVTRPEENLTELQMELQIDVKKTLAELAAYPLGLDIIDKLTQPNTDNAPEQSPKTKKIESAIRMGAMRTLLAAEQIKGRLDPNGTGHANRLLQLQQAQEAALRRYQKPGTALDPVAQGHYNLIRSRLMTADGNMEPMNSAAATLMDFHNKFQRQIQVAGRRTVGPNGVRANGRLVANAFHGILPAMLHGRPIAYTREQWEKIRVLNNPASVVNQGSLYELSKTATAYSADMTAKTVIRLDKQLIDLSDRLKQATLDHIAVANRTPMTDATRQRYIAMLAQVAAASVAKQFITTAKESRGEDRDHIRPEHLCILELPPGETNPAVSEINAKLTALCQEAGLATPAAPHLEPHSEPLDLAGMIAEASAASIRAGVAPGYPLDRDHLMMQLRTLEMTLGIASKNLPEAAADDAPVAAARESLQEAQKVRQVILATEPVEPISTITYDSVRELLYSFVQQAELRAKFRLTTATTNDFNLKPVGATSFTDAISDESHMSAPVGAGFKVRAEGRKGKSQFMEVAYTTDGFEITIGTEVRTAKSAGGAFSLSGGYADGVGVAKGLFTLDGAVVREKIRHTGVKFLIERSTSGEYTDEEVRAGENRKLVEMLFPLAGHAGIQALCNAENPVGHLRAILEHCPHISINRIDVSFDNNGREEYTGNVGFLGKLAVVGATQIVGVQHNETHRSTAVYENTGTRTSDKHSRGRSRNTQTQAAWNIGLSLPFLTGNGRKGNVGIASLFSGAKAWLVNSGGTERKYRFAMENGKTLVNSTRNDVEFSRAKDLLEAIENNYEEVIAHTIDQRFTKGYEKSSVAEKRLMAKEVIEGLKTKILECEREGKMQTLRNVFAISKRITEAAAVQNDILMGDRIRLENRVNRLEKDPVARAQRSNAPGRVAADAERVVTHAQRMVARAERVVARARRGNALRGRVAAGADLAVTADEELRVAKLDLAANYQAQENLFDDPGSWKIWKITASERTSGLKGNYFGWVYDRGHMDSADSQRPLFSYPT